MGANKLLWGYDSDAGEWLPVLVDASGNLLVDLSGVNLDDLGDVVVPTPAAGELLTWDAVTSKWINSAPALPTIHHGATTGLGDDDHPQYALDTDLTTHEADTSTHGVTQVDGVVERNAAIAAIELDDLFDVNAPAPGANEVLTWDNVAGEWIAAPAAGGVTDHDLLNNLNWAAAGHIIDADVDFAKFKAVAMACDNGATAPAAPVIGQWFLHTPTGRSVLMQYSGTAWVPIISLGTMTMYVDKTDGTDAVDKGGAVDAGAFKTVQYAINAIPPLYSGNVLIIVNNEAYAENLVFQGKCAAGNFYIELRGTMSTSVADTAATAGSATTITCAGGLGVNGYQYQRIRITSGTGVNQWAIIKSHTDTIVTIVGEWAMSDFTPFSPIASIGNGAGNGVNPDNTSHFVVENWSTNINPAALDGITVKAAQQGILLTNLKCTMTGSRYGFNSTDGGHAEARGCYFTGGRSAIAQVHGSFKLNACRFDAATWVILVMVGFKGLAHVTNCAIINAGVGNYGIYVESHSTIVLCGNYVYNNGADGMYIGTASLAYHGTNSYHLCTYSTNGGWGIQAVRLGVVVNASAQTFAGNVSGTYTPVAITGGGCD